MKKIFTLFLALLFLTGCNTTPPVGTDANGPMLSGSSSGDSTGTSSSSNTNKETTQDQLVYRYNNELIDLPSRIVFEATINQQTRTYYYSKADSKAYVYCFDPLCDHTHYTCLGSPAKNNTGWSFGRTTFINNRFYTVNAYGKIYSFAFDGTDKKLEYDAGYITSKTVWGNMIAYGSYIYISSKAEEKKHTLRYNTETKQMEDLTEKTGNYIYPSFFHKGLIYGLGDSAVTLDTFFRSDMNLNMIEPVEEIPIEQISGNILVGNVYKKRQSTSDYPEQIGISFYDIETGEQRIVTKEDLGLDYYPAFVAATDEYFYFYEPNALYIGTAIFNQGGKELERQVQKLNDGKLYRMNKDRTNIVCVYDNPEYELDSNVVIYDDKIVMQGRYMKVENKVQTIWGGAIQVATINPDGTIGEFVEVEILQ